jgi:hypothetical protein
MVTGILSQVTGQLDRRFLLNAFFPTVAFSLLVALTVATGTGGVGPALDLWKQASSVVQVLLAVGWVAVVFVTANLLANAGLWITRLFEGYAAPASWFAPWGRNYHQWRAKSVLEHDPEGFQRCYPVYPRALSRDDVAPTRLGNLLLSAESYAEDRYGVPAVRVWPRLYHLLPAVLVSSMSEARASMEFLLVMAFLAALYAPAAGIYLLACAGPTAWFLGALFGGALVAAVAYAASLAPAAVYGDHVRAAFDMHRLELLAAIRAPAPATLDEERRIWDQAVVFLDGGHPHLWRYVAGK